MKRIVVVSDMIEHSRALAGRLAEFFEAEAFALDKLPLAAPDELTLVDVDVRSPAKVASLKNWLKRRPANGQVIFSVNRESHAESIQAFAAGATDVVRRPVNARLLAWRLSGGISSIANESDAAGGEATACISAGVSALQGMFAAVLSGETPSIRAVAAASADVVEKLEEEGLSRWLEIVRNHHSQTYQHSLIVTAVAVSFGKHLGFNRADKERLALAGLLHDIGKAKIPIEILEKPAALNEEEMAVMRNHPTLGFDALKESPGLQPEMLDMVVHHHEYLDGSGYPHGLLAREISDLVRTMTIADIYGALIERRPYKPPLPGSTAYEILQDMGPKLDKDLVREFRPFALGMH